MPRMRAYVWLLASAAFAQTEFRGRLDPELHVLPVIHQGSEFKLATNRPSVARPEDKVFQWDVRGALAYVVESAARESVLYVDTDGDKQIGSGEKHALSPATDSLHAGIADVRFPHGADRWRERGCASRKARSGCRRPYPRTEQSHRLRFLGCTQALCARRRGRPCHPLLQMGAALPKA